VYRDTLNLKALSTRLTNYMLQSTSSDANNHSASRETLGFYGIRSFITVLTVRQWFLS